MGEQQVAVNLFNRGLADGGMPYAIVSEHGPPPRGWRFVTESVKAAYGTYSAAPEPAKKKAKRPPRKKPQPSDLEGLPALESGLGEFDADASGLGLFDVDA